jgi:dynein heavy chain
MSNLIELTRTWILEWREILKIIRVLQVLKEKHVLSYRDTQIKSEVFLLDINSILNSGEIQNLFEMMSVKRF